MFTAGTDITTAVTDLINAAVSIFLMCRLIGRGANQKRDVLWVISFALFILVSITGFFIHGLAAAADPDINQILRRALPVCLTIGTVFSVVALIIMFLTTYRNGFTVFVVYCVACLLVMIVILIKHRHDHKALDLYLTAAILLAIANCVQTLKFIEFTLVWDFNYDSVYHWILLIFVLVQYTGIRRRETR